MKIQLNKGKKPIAFLLIGIILVLLITVPIFAFSGIGDEEVEYIQGTDIIKNFQLRSFEGERLTSGNTVPSLGNRLMFESGSYWKAYESDLEGVQVFTVGNQCIFKYELTFTNYINIYTNVFLSDVAENIATITDKIKCGTFVFKGPLGVTVKDWWNYYIYWDHYDFGNVETYTARNIFSGPLVLDFDIASSPLPDAFTDDKGNSITKDFDYIGVSGAYVGEQIWGKMTEDKPEFQQIIATDHETWEGESTDDPITEKGSYPSGFTFEWKPNIQLSDPPIEDPIDFGLIPQTSYTSMNPRLKDGSPSWNATETGKSMPDCMITYSLPRLCPIVYQYRSILKYDFLTLEVYNTKPLTHHSSINEGMTKTGDVGLHVINRYIQALIKVRFNVYSSFTIDVKTGEFLLAQPQEYYDELLWTTIVHGFGGSIIHIDERPGLFDWLNNWWITLIIIVAIGVLIYIGYKVLTSYLEGRKIEKYITAGRRDF